MQRNKWIEQKRQQRERIVQYYNEHGLTETAEHFGISNQRVWAITHSLVDNSLKENNG